MKSIDALSRSQARQLAAALGLGNARLPLLLPGAARSSVALAPEPTPEDVRDTFRPSAYVLLSTFDFSMVRHHNAVVARWRNEGSKHSWETSSRCHRDAPDQNLEHMLFICPHPPSMVALPDHAL